MPARRKRRNREDEYLRFISDKSLRSDIEDALGFATWLIGSVRKNIKKEYKREVYRVVILYVASAVEALCLYMMHTHGLKNEETKYDSPSHVKLPAGVSVPSGKKLALVWCEKTIPSLPATPFKNSINSLSNGSIIRKPFADDLHWLREKRNTQHLYARKSKRVLKKDVTKSVNVLLRLFEYMQD